MPTAITSLSRRNGDVFIETQSPNYGFTQAKVKNSTGAAVDISKYDMIGRPVKLVTGVWELAIPGTDEATVDGLVFDPQEGIALASAATSPRMFTIMLRGPAVVNLSNIVSGFTKATLATALLALSILHKESAAVNTDSVV
jgi:hypothetical protein